MICGWRNTWYISSAITRQLVAQASPQLSAIWTSTTSASYDPFLMMNRLLSDDATPVFNLNPGRKCFDIQTWNCIWFDTFIQDLDISGKQNVSLEERLITVLNFFFFHLMSKISSSLLWRKPSFVSSSPSEEPIDQLQLDLRRAGQQTLTPTITNKNLIKSSLDSLRCCSGGS